MMSQFNEGRKVNKNLGNQKYKIYLSIQNIEQNAG